MKNDREQYTDISTAEELVEFIGPEIPVSLGVGCVGVSDYLPDSEILFGKAHVGPNGAFIGVDPATRRIGFGGKGHLLDTGNLHYWNARDKIAFVEGPIQDFQETLQPLNIKHAFTYAPYELKLREILPAMYSLVKRGGIIQIIPIGFPSLLPIAKEKIQQVEATLNIKGSWTEFESWTDYKAAEFAITGCINRSNQSPVPSVWTFTKS